jgi:hypothetical protein
MEVLKLGPRRLLRNKGVQLASKTVLATIWSLLAKCTLASLLKRMPGENMTEIITRTFLVVLLSVAASAALSQTNQGQNNHNQGQNYQGDRAVGAPEIDPAQALSALALLGGTLAIIRGYRREEKSHAAR